MGQGNPEQSAEVFEQARIACYSSLGGTLEAIPCKSLILFTFNPLRDATIYGNIYSNLQYLGEFLRGFFLF